MSAKQLKILGAVLWLAGVLLGAMALGWKGVLIAAGIGALTGAATFAVGVKVPMPMVMMPMAVGALSSVQFGAAFSVAVVHAPEAVAVAMSMAVSGGQLVAIGYAAQRQLMDLAQPNN